MQTGLYRIEEGCAGQTNKVIIIKPDYYKQEKVVITTTSTLY